MYCIIQFYYQIHLDIVEFRPFLKLLSIKLVIFFVFWQTVCISKHSMLPPFPFYSPDPHALQLTLGLLLLDNPLLP